MSVRVLLTKALQDTDLAYLNEGLDESVEIVVPKSFDEAGVVESMAGIDVVLGGMITEAIAHAATGVKLFQIPWTGVDGLNFDVIEKHNLVVGNSHSNSMIVAEHAVAMWLALAKKLPYHDRMLRSGKWNRVSPQGNDVSPFSSEIFGANVLLVGCGSIGCDIAALVSGFGCEISSVTPSGQCSLSSCKKCWAADELDSALGDADVVFLSVPLTETTKGLFDSAQFAAMKSSALFVNISRGTTVDESALYDALKTDRIGGAAIDTWYNYPSADTPKILPSKQHSFQDLDNLLMSPHRAGYSNVGFPHLNDAIDNINRLVRGETLKNIINVSKGY